MTNLFGRLLLIFPGFLRRQLIDATWAENVSRVRMLVSTGANFGYVGSFCLGQAAYRGYTEIGRSSLMLVSIPMFQTFITIPRYSSLWWQEEGSAHGCLPRHVLT